MSAMESLSTTNPLPAVEDKDLIDEVFSHKSLAPIPVASLQGDEHEKQRMLDNERLAFLGDQVLHMCTTDLFFKKNPAETIGLMNDNRTLCVKKKQVAKWSDAYNLPQGIRAPTHQQIAIQDSQLRKAHVFQAYLAAVYLDQGYEIIREWIEKLVNASWDDIQATAAAEREAEELAERMAQMRTDNASTTGTSGSIPTPTATGSLLSPSVATSSPPRSPSIAPNLGSPNSSKTYTSLLHEMCAQLHYASPEWTTTEEGLPHQRTYTMTVKIKERSDIQAEGTAKTKTEAKHLAARQAVDLLNA